MLSGKLTQPQVNSLNTVLDAIAFQTVSYQAYELVMIFHETNQPVKELGGVAYYIKLYDVTGQNPTRARSMPARERISGSICQAIPIWSMVKPDYVNARKAINAIDKADFIAGYARSLRPLSLV